MIHHFFLEWKKRQFEYRLSVSKLKWSATWLSLPVSYVISSEGDLTLKADRFFDLSESKPLVSTLLVALQNFRDKPRGEEETQFYFKFTLCHLAVHIQHFIPFHNPVGNPITPTLQMNKLRLREVKYYDQVRKTGMWKSQDLSRDLSYSKASVLSNILCKSLNFKKANADGKSIYHYPGLLLNISL